MQQQQRNNGARPSAEITRAMPNNLDAERAVLGCIMLDNDVLAQVIGTIEPEDFYQHGHAATYEVMLAMYSAGRALDLTQVADELRKRGQLDSAGGYVYLAGLEQYVLSSSAAPELAKMVREKAILRRTARICERGLAAACEEAWREDDKAKEDFSAERLLDRTTGELFAEMSANQSKTVRHGRTVLREIERIIDGHVETGLPTGMHEFDQMTGGIHRNELVMLGARPGTGKTAFVCQVLQHVADPCIHDSACLFFSLEMGAEEIWLRMLCQKAQVSFTKTRSGEINAYECHRLHECRRAMDPVTDNLFIDDRAALTPMQVRAKARQVKIARPNLRLIVIDYLTLMRPSRRLQQRYQEVGEICSELAAMAKEVAPVLCLAQLSRDAEHERPALRHFRESGNIEQDAWQCWALYVDAKVREDNADQPILPVEIIALKNRNGQIGRRTLDFVKESMLFKELERDRV